MLRRLREQMCVRNMACRLRAKSAQVRDVLLSVELFELDGEPFLLVIAQDITDLVKMENQLRQRKSSRRSASWPRAWPMTSTTS